MSCVPRAVLRRSLCFVLRCRADRYELSWLLFLRGKSFMAEMMIIARECECVAWQRRVFGELLLLLRPFCEVPLVGRPTMRCLPACASFAVRYSCSCTRAAWTPPLSLPALQPVQRRKGTNAGQFTVISRCRPMWRRRGAQDTRFGQLSCAQSALVSWNRY